MANQITKALRDEVNEKFNLKFECTLNGVVDIRPVEILRATKSFVWFKTKPNEMGLSFPVGGEYVDNLDDDDVKAVIRKYYPVDDVSPIDKATEEALASVTEADFAEPAKVETDAEKIARLEAELAAYKAKEAKAEPVSAPEQPKAEFKLPMKCGHWTVLEKDGKLLALSKKSKEWSASPKYMRGADGKKGRQLCGWNIVNRTGTVRATLTLNGWYNQKKD